MLLFEINLESFVNMQHIMWERPNSDKQKYTCSRYKVMSSDYFRYKFDVTKPNTLRTFESLKYPHKTICVHPKKK